ncbi:MAG: HAMP domain-containing sensor histidine kinase [Nevskia sp.]|nr:HAMP domain-containing sensor histidine kinase [Nevskia sp.]
MAVEAPLGVGDIVRRYRLRAVGVMQIAFLLGAATGCLFFLGDPAVLRITAFAMLCSTASLLLSRRGRLSLATLLLAVQLLYLPPLLALHETGMYDAAMYLMPVTMMMVALTERPRFVWSFNAAVFASACFVFYATVHGLNGQRLSADPPLHFGPDGFTILIIMALCVFVTGYLSQIMQRLLDRVVADQAQLEQRVSARTVELSEALERLRTTQEQLVQSEKLASLGTLVAGLAHEINTPIGVGVTAASHLQESAGRLASAQTAGTLTRTQLAQFTTDCEAGSKILVNNLQRAAGLVQSFKQVAADQASDERRTIALKSYLQDVLQSLQPQLNKTPHAVQLDCEEDLQIDTVPGALSQVVTNLLLNSLLHAYEPGQRGAIRISVRKGDDWVHLSYADDGRGIPPEHLGRIFEPFFTTRRGQGGTGLGLHIVYNLVHALLRGTIVVGSTGGKGTVFDIRLPLRLPEPDQAPAGPA